ncbi:MAG: DeoR family transcriptional regulator [Treponema sp.]|jgi:DeoR/GlpR family transcriptional regulator of sugar metabolism|nr:DeoR family transcriptional regulator [Treponema sp.]
MTERQNRILEILAEYRQVYECSLAEALNASQESIRRDLEHLDKTGLIRREQGYTVFKNSSALPIKTTKLSVSTMSCSFP